MTNQLRTPLTIALLAATTLAGFAQTRRQTRWSAARIMPGDRDIARNPEFSLATNSDGPYVLRFVNGDAQDLHRVTAGTVTLNGVAILGRAQISDRVEFLEVPLGSSLPVDNALVVQLQSASDAYVTIIVEETDAQAAVRRPGIPWRVADRRPPQYNRQSSIQSTILNTILNPQSSIQSAIANRQCNPQSAVVSRQCTSDPCPGAPDSGMLSVYVVMSP
jgi:hypothetical protein